MDYNKVIKSVGCNQHEILYNIMQLHNNGKSFDCDITYSKGNFYGRFPSTLNEGEGVIEIPQPKYKFDVCPQTEDTVKIDPQGQIPLEDESIDSIVIDLPFVLGVGPSIKEDKKGQNIILKRFSCYYPAQQLYESYTHWLTEAYRVLKLNGVCIFKTQATISGGVNHDVPTFSKMIAMKIGFINDDEFILTAKSRLISGKIKKQNHARKFHSSFLIFKKWNNKRYFKFDYNKLIDELIDSKQT